MKKLKIRLVAGIFLFTILLHSRINKASSVKLNLNGQLIPLDQEAGLPFNKDGRILVPLRFVTENLGYRVSWNQELREAQLENGQQVISLATDGRDPRVNGEPVSLDVKPLLKDGRIFVPIRFIGQLSQKHVNYSSLAGQATVFISDQEIYISPEPASYRLEKINIGGREIAAHVISLDFKDPRIRVETALAQDRVNSLESFFSLLARKQPLAAINGYFFDSYSGSQATNGYIKNKFQTLNYEVLDTAFFVDSERGLHMESPHFFPGGEDSIETLVSVLPHLVRDSQNLAQLGEDMSHGKGLVRATRTGLGFNDQQVIKLVTANNLTNAELAELMLKLGCSSAGNLDGGASSAMYYDSRIIRSPGRKLNNFLLFYLD